VRLLDERGDERPPRAANRGRRVYDEASRGAAGDGVGGLGDELVVSEEEISTRNHIQGTRCRLVGSHLRGDERVNQGPPTDVAEELTHPLEPAPARFPIVREGWFFLLSLDAP